MTPPLPQASRLALKADVDTLTGSLEGVPRLREILDQRGIKASFYLSLGPDNSGKAVFRAFTRPGFLKKQLRSRAASAFGWRTLLSGTLLPAPIIGERIQEAVDGLKDSGHEIGLHAWDHVKWHDKVWLMTGPQAIDELKPGVEALGRLTGSAPEGYAAPGWRISADAAAYLEEAGFAYTAATRGRSPYRPRIDGRLGKIPEIPTTLPTADEVLGVDGLGPNDLPDFFLQKLRPGDNVMTIHAEMEGRILADPFARLLDQCLKRGVTFITLIDYARELQGRPDLIPVADVIRVAVPGRAGKVSHQAA